MPMDTAFKSGEPTNAGPRHLLAVFRNWMRRRPSPTLTRPCLRTTEERVDEALEETFPASDPPAFMGGLAKGSRFASGTRT
jgi:hypothetical protein